MPGGALRRLSARKKESTLRLPGCWLTPTHEEQAYFVRWVLKTALATRRSVFPNESTRDRAEKLAARLPNRGVWLLEQADTRVIQIAMVWHRCRQARSRIELREETARLRHRISRELFEAYCMTWDSLPCEFDCLNYAVTHIETQSAGWPESTVWHTCDEHIEPVREVTFNNDPGRDFRFREIRTDCVAEYFGS